MRTRKYITATGGNIMNVRILSHSSQFGSRRTKRSLLDYLDLYKQRRAPPCVGCSLSLEPLVPVLSGRKLPGSVTRLLLLRA